MTLPEFWETLRCRSLTGANQAKPGVACRIDVVRACEAGAAIRENVRQFRRARARRKQHGGPLEAALSAVQVGDRADLSPEQILQRLATTAPRTLRGRARTPALVRRHAKLAVDGPVHETWTFGYLIDTIYLRDPWLHRTDAARALDQQPELTASHDGRTVADVVAEWAEPPSYIWGQCAPR